MALYSDPRLLALGVVHGTTDRAAGNMRLSENTQYLFNALNIDPCAIARFKQVHSDRIIYLTSTEQARQTHSLLTEADAWILSGTGLGAAILTADCVPLILWDETAQVIGLAHCGWRAVAAGLPGKMVRSMRRAGAQGTLSAWAGPHIQACCFEVQADVAAQFPDCLIEKNGKLFVDLNRAISIQLTAENIPAAAVRFPYYCTCGDKQRFFSYRRDHTKDALLTFVYKP